MSIAYNLAVSNARLQAVANAIDAGLGNGVLRLLDSGNSIISSIAFSKPCGTVSDRVLTFSGMSLIDVSAARSGNIVAARIEDSAGNVVISGLTAAGVPSIADLVMSPSNAVQAGQTVAITAATITTATPPVGPVPLADLLLSDAISFLLLVSGAYLELAQQ